MLNTLLLGKGKKKVGEKLRNIRPIVAVFLAMVLTARGIANIK